MENEVVKTEKSIFDSVDIDEETELRVLVRSIEFADSFTLLIANCNSRQKQKEIIEELQKRISDKNVEVVYFGHKIEHLLDELNNKVFDEKPEVLFIYGFEESIPTAAGGFNTPLVKNLNASRNSFPSYFNCPIVLFLPNYAVNSLINGSPDFFSINSGIFFFKASPEELKGQISGAISSEYTEIQGLEFDERNNRIEAVKELLNEYESLPEKERSLETEYLLKGKLFDLYYISAQYNKAEKLSKVLLEYAIKLKDEQKEATGYNDLASLYQSQGRYEEAEPYYIKSLEILQKVLGEDHPSTAGSYNNLAELYRTQGRYEEAEPYYLKSLKIFQKVLGEDHPDTATGYNNLAELYRTQGRYEEAEPYFLKSLEIKQKVLGEDHPSTAGSYNNLAGLYQSQERYEEAEPYFLKSLEIRKKVLGENHPSTATSYNNLALIYFSQGRYEEAEPYYLKSLKIRQKVLGEDHPETATSYGNLGGLRFAQRKYQEALDLYEKGLEIFQKTLPENHPHIKIFKNWISHIKEAMEK